MYNVHHTVGNPTIRQLSTVLKGTQSKWFIFGIHMDVPFDELEKIEVEELTVDQRMLAVLEYCLKNHDTAYGSIWIEVALALEKN